MQQLTMQQIYLLRARGCEVNIVPSWGLDLIAGQTFTTVVVESTSSEATVLMVPPPTLEVARIPLFRKMGECIEITPNLLNDGFGTANVKVSIGVTGGPNLGQAVTVSDILADYASVEFHLPGSYVLHVKLETPFGISNYDLEAECVYPFPSLTHLPKTISARVGEEIRLFGVIPDLYEGDEAKIALPWTGRKILTGARVENGALVFTPHKAGNTAIKLNFKTKAGRQSRVIKVIVAEAETAPATDNGNTPHTTETEPVVPKAIIFQESSVGGENGTPEAPEVVDVPVVITPVPGPETNETIVAE